MLCRECLIYLSHVASLGLFVCTYPEIRTFKSDAHRQDVVALISKAVYEPRYLLQLKLLDSSSNKTAVKIVKGILFTYGNSLKFG